MTRFFSSNKRALRLNWISALLSGITIGAILNFAEFSGVPGASDFGNYFGLWIFLITMIAVWSLSWQRAVLHTVTFLIAMITAYYLSTLLLSGYFLAHLLRSWVVITIVFAPPFAAFVWRARNSDWFGALAAAMPIGLLLYEAYKMSLVPWLRGFQLVFDCVTAVVLLIILPKNQIQCLRVFLFIPIFALGAKLVIEYILPIAAQFRF